MLNIYVQYNDYPSSWVCIIKCHPPLLVGGFLCYGHHLKATSITALADVPAKCTLAHELAIDAVAETPVQTRLVNTRTVQLTVVAMETGLTAARVLGVRQIATDGVVLTGSREARIVTRARCAEVAVVAGARVVGSADARADARVHARTRATRRHHLAAFADETICALARVRGGGEVAARGTVQTHGVHARVVMLTRVAVVTATTDTLRASRRYLWCAAVTTVELKLADADAAAAAALGDAVNAGTLAVARTGVGLSRRRRWWRRCTEVALSPGVAHATR